MYASKDIKEVPADNKKKTSESIRYSRRLFANKRKTEEEEEQQQLEPPQRQLQQPPLEQQKQQQIQIKLTIITSNYN